MTCQVTKSPGRIQDWSADSPVRAFLASDHVRADKAVRAPVSPFLESTLPSDVETFRILAGSCESLLLCAACCAWTRNTCLRLTENDARRVQEKMVTLHRQGNVGIPRAL